MIYFYNVLGHEQLLLISPLCCMSSDAISLWWRGRMNSGKLSAAVVESSRVLGLRMKANVWSLLHQLPAHPVPLIGRAMFITFVFLLFWGGRCGFLMDLVVQDVYWEAEWDIVHHQQKSDTMGKMESKFLVQVWILILLIQSDFLLWERKHTEISVFVLLIQ